MMQTIEEMLIGDLPPALLEAIKSDLIMYSVGFVRFKKTPYGTDYILRGSGTLVKVGVTHAVLTAHHVLEELPRIGRLGLILSLSSQSHTFDTQGLEYLKIDRGIKDSDGPDIGAVVLAPNIAASIQAKKVFYNLELRRDLLLKTPPHFRGGVWFVNGFIDEETITRRNHDGYDLIKEFHNVSYALGPEPSIIAGYHDYFVLPFSPAGRSVAPKSFGGISGGGLWQVPLKRDKDGNLYHQPPLLSGVVFYQECDSEGAFAVKCHGRVSVYQVAYDALNRIGSSFR
jgi:hypothetical protein